MPPIVILWCVAVLLGAAVLGAVASRKTASTALVYGACLAASTVALVVAIAYLVGNQGDAPEVVLPLGLPWLGAHFRIDALAAFFLTVVNLGAVAASLFAIGYGRHEDAPERVLPFYPAFLAGMNLVVLADDAFTFLVSWEFMSLSSWALVMSHHRERDNAYAGYVYIAMASFGTLALLLAYGMLAGPDGSYAFADIRANHPSAGLAAIVLLLALVGAGSKAGLVPLHVWLPLAHPAAPSHVSALMSGVMTKVAVYGFVRIVFDLVGPPTWWWSMVVLALGGITAVMGVLYALMQHDLKRLLAYHTVENIGIIFIGLGLALAFAAHGMPTAAALAMTAGLLHVFNHSVFKSLLFFGAGAVLTSTGERDMEHLGGLIHRMPQSSFAFLIGCVAISALPPFNGFVSEWLTFQAILLSPQLPSWGLKFLVPAVGALLALSAALAAACFVKAFGVTFLGRPRTRAAADAAETDRFSLAAMFLFATLCLFAGILPGFFIDALSPVVTGLCRRPRARATRHRMASDRAYYREPQFLRRHPCLPVRRAFGNARGVRNPPICLRPPAKGPAVGLRRARFESGHPVHRDELCPADSPRVRNHSVWRAGGRRHAAARRCPGRASDSDDARFCVGCVLRAARRWRHGHRHYAQLPAVPNHPALSQLCLSGARAVASGARDMALIRDFILQCAQMLLVLALAPLLTGFVRKLKARFQRRIGPPVLQPYRDLIRLMRKDVVLADTSSWLFRVIPYLVFGGTWVATALVPTFKTGLLFSMSADLIAIVALLGSARFFLALAGLDVGTSFGGIGSSREVMIASLAEPAMIMIVFTLALTAGSTQLSTIAAYMNSPAVGLRISLAMVLFALIIVAIAENARIPVDNPATHLELTMVHEAMVLEYSGRHLALIELSASLKLLLYISAIACLFVPWGLVTQGVAPVAMALGVLAYLGKLAVGGALLALFETVIAKMRVFRVPEFLGAALMLGLLGTLLLFVSRSL